LNPDNDDSTKYALREYFGAAGGQAIHLPWHFQLLRTGADEILMLGVMDAAGCDAAIFLAASYDDGATWNLPYRPPMPAPRPGNLSGSEDNAFTWDSGLYTPTGVYVEGGNDKIEMLYTGLKTKYLAGTWWHTFYTTMNFSAFPTVYNYDAIYGLAAANANCNLTFECFKNDSFWIFVDSIKASAPETDSFGVKFNFDNPFDLDSLIFEYMSQDTSIDIDSIALYVPKNGKGHSYLADSLAWGTGEDRNSATFSRVALKWRDVFAAGEELRVKFFITGSVNGRAIRMRQLFLKGRTFEE
jgi:hypothetical protein